MERYHCQHAGVYGGQFTVAQIQTGLQNGTMPLDVQVFNHHYNQWMPAAYFLQACQLAQGGNPTWSAGTQQSPLQQPAGAMPAVEVAQEMPVDQGKAPSVEHEQAIEEPEGNDWLGLDKLKWAAGTIVLVLIMAWGKSAAVDAQSGRREQKRLEEEGKQKRFQKQLDDVGKKAFDDFKR